MQSIVLGDIVRIPSDVFYCDNAKNKLGLVIDKNNYEFLIRLIEDCNCGTRFNENLYKGHQISLLETAMVVEYRLPLMKLVFDV